MKDWETFKKGSSQAPVTADYFKRIPKGLFDGIIYTLNFSDPSSFYINDRFQELLGYPKKELEAKGAALIAEIIHPDDREASAAILSGISKDGSHISQGEYRLKDTSGKWHRFLDRTLATQFTPDGQVLEIVGIATEIKETAAASAEPGEPTQGADARFRLIIDANPGAMYIVDTADLSIIEANETGRELLEAAGPSPKLAIAQLFPETERKEILTWLHECATRGTSAKRSLKLLMPNGHEIDSHADVNIIHHDKDVFLRLDLRDNHVPTPSEAADSPDTLALLDSLPGKLAVLDEEGRILIANNECRSFFGESGTSATYIEHVSAKDRALFSGTLASCRSGTSQQITLNLTDADETPHRHICSLSCHPSDPGHFVILAVKEPKKTTAKPNFNFKPASLELLSDFSVKSWDSNAAIMTGYTSDDVIGRDLVSLVIPRRNRPKVYALIQSSIDNGTSQSSQQTIRSKSRVNIPCIWEIKAPQNDTLSITISVNGD